MMHNKWKSIMFFLFFCRFDHWYHNKLKQKKGTCEPFLISCQQGVKPQLKLASMTGVRLHRLHPMMVIFFNGFYGFPSWETERVLPGYNFLCALQTPYTTLIFCTLNITNSFSLSRQFIFWQLQYDAMEQIWKFAPLKSFIQLLHWTIH